MKTEHGYYLMFVKNYGTLDTGVISAPSKEYMHEKLLDKGFNCDEKHEVYVGFDKAGNEVSVKKLQPRHVNDLKNHYES